MTIVRKGQPMRPYRQETAMAIRNPTNGSTTAEPIVSLCDQGGGDEIRDRAALAECESPLSCIRRLRRRVLVAAGRIMRNRQRVFEPRIQSAQRARTPRFR